MWRPVLFILFCGWCDGYRVLLMFPVASKSHQILGDGFVRNLLEAGHELTYVTPYPAKRPAPNLRQVDLSSNQKKLENEVVNLRAILDNTSGGQDPKALVQLMVQFVNDTLRHENFQKLILDTSDKYDVVVVDWAYSEAFAGLSAVFDCPLIWFSSIEPHSTILSLIDEPLNPAYNPDVRSTNINPLTFKQRVSSLTSQVLGSLFKNFYMYPKDKNMYETYFGPAMTARGKTLPPFDEIIYSGSLVIGNSHVSLGEATKVPQNYKPIGGYHIDNNLTPLPKDLQKIMDEAKDGVIYFSMGSILKSADWPTEIKTGLLKMFGELRQTVLWKFEEDLQNVPKNVHLLKWAPQNSILNHSNCLTFVTHGGLLSTTEAIHHGVPVIGIPVFGDQFANVGRAANKGFALQVSLTYDVADDLKKAILDVINDPKYKAKAKQLSFVYHDRPTSPGAELSHWVRHVVLTKGAPHLHSPALLLSWYQKAYLDLIAIVVVTQAVVITIAMKTIRSLCRKKVDSVKKRN